MSGRPITVKINHLGFVKIQPLDYDGLAEVSFTVAIKDVGFRFRVHPIQALFGAENVQVAISVEVCDLQAVPEVDISQLV